ncbi:MAG: tetratricopeptide repeat protein [Thermodesulfobacteriota bacterium]
MISLANFIKDLKRFKILLVDDEAPNRRNLRSILQSLGFASFREAEDGDDALKKLKVETFGFIFCDWAMPLMSGLELLRLIRSDKFSLEVPMIMIASPLEERIVADNTKTPNEAYLIRPLLPQNVEDKMVEVLFRNLSPSPFEIHLQAAGAFLAQGRYAEAHAELDKAAGINPRATMVPYFRRLVFEAEGRPDQAAEAITLARQAFTRVVYGPREAEAKIRLGQGLLAQGLVQEAKATFAQALEHNPDNQNLQAEIGELYLANGLAEEAQKIFQDSLEADPGNVYLYNRLGMAFRRQKKFAEAVASYQKALTLDPQEENLHYNLARAYLAAGDRIGAVASLQIAVELAPAFNEASGLLERLQSTETKNYLAP